MPGPIDAVIDAGVASNEKIVFQLREVRIGKSWRPALPCCTTGASNCQRCRNRTRSASEGQPAHPPQLPRAPNAHSARSRTLLAHRSARRIPAAGRGQQATERAGWSSTNEHPRHVLTAAAAVQTRSASAIASCLTAPFARGASGVGAIGQRYALGRMLSRSPAHALAHQRTHCVLSFLLARQSGLHRRACTALVGGEAQQRKVQPPYPRLQQLSTPSLVAYAEPFGRRHGGGARGSRF